MLMTSSLHSSEINLPFLMVLENTRSARGSEFMNLFAKSVSSRELAEKRSCPVSRLNRMLPRLKISDFSD